MDETTKAVAAVKAMVGDVPADFRFNGQTFDERVEAWIQHAVDQIQEEIDSL